MLVSGITKRVTPQITRSALRGTISKRSFSFSSFTWSNSNSGVNGAAAAAAGAAAGAGAAAASSNYNPNSIPDSFQYDISVAYQPKDREETNLFKRNNKLTSKTPAQESPTGEDNLFVSAPNSSGYLALGVADGVGGWSEAGYDSSAISRELCSSMKAIFEQESIASTEYSPKQLLSVAFSDILKSPKVEIGGTTACLGILTPDYKLKVANLGDSWCGVFRDYKLIKETNFQTHNFNTPFQLAKIPKQILRQAELQGRRYIIDSPEMADEYSWDVQKGDVIIFATDGVTDNIVPGDIEIFLKDMNVSEEGGKLLNEVTSEFVTQVVKLSKDTNYPSAFAQELSRLTGQKYLGGKEDDITVVFAKVK
ncbi:protein phosphatase 2C homolog 7, mitochondrial [[Candida] railenensis]|uniref:Protein phosphatase n=1 Tax=[Candida] railenensis TaxID=45579 RepID=A0A9P0QSJ3_9ASCO|nr:protein phosphatase 2C homolog 7, mitochondrial [[Candida] railenensis]